GDEDRLAHRAFVATLGDKPIWNEFLPAASVAAG
ncbi:MAG: DNA polymerase III subunit epsilon, partial [Bradyrhizobium icense]